MAGAEFLLNPALGNQAVGAGTAMAGPLAGAPTILGMKPAMFAALAGAVGQAVSQKDSWQSRLGGVAANFGSQKIQQLAMAEKEKKQEELYKAILQKMSPEQIGSVATSGILSGKSEYMNLDKMRGNFNLGTANESLFK